MGSPRGWLRWRTLRSSWFGHQSRLVRALPLPFEPVTGQVRSFSIFISPSLLGTVGAQAPVDDLGLVDRIAVGVGRGQAGRVADGAVDIGDGAARAAHEVVV